LVGSYAGGADLAELSDVQAYDVARFRRATGILNGEVLIDGVSYRDLAANVRALGGSLRAECTDAAARELVARIIANERVLGWLVAARYGQKIRRRSHGHRGGPDLAENIAHIEATLDSDPDCRFALSLDNLLACEPGRPLGIELIQDYARETDPATLTGQLAADVARLRRGTAIRRGRILLDGMTFDNLEANVDGMMGSLSNFATSTEARDLVMRIVAAVPSLAADIAAEIADNAARPGF
ncbi:MAG TPA: hypothetical protein VF867_02970, partial [Arthrobacter sp.]